MEELPPDDLSDDEFYFKHPYNALIDPDIWRGKNPWHYDIAKLLPEFYSKMEGNFKFKILGLALQSAAKLHYAKILYLIHTEEKFKEHLEIERKRHESSELGRLGLPLRRLGEEADSDDLFDELVTMLLDEKKRLEKKIEKEQKLQEGTATRRRRVPLSEAMDMDDFYEVDADRMNIQEKNEMVLDAIKNLCAAAPAPDHEITFGALMQALTGMASDIRIQTARILLSILFLIADRIIDADQDVETHEIFIRMPSN
ncbi:MAG: hypothetical protein EU536_01295 [Promethearchaeota archaeon]|nr:MAG: hypothetical protein EU536_01295 [Candidatus Lokiarchaeota archaeon]